MCREKGKRPLHVVRHSSTNTHETRFQDLCRFESFLALGFVAVTWRGDTPRYLLDDATMAVRERGRARIVKSAEVLKDSTTLEPGIASAFLCAIAEAMFNGGLPAAPALAAEEHHNLREDLEIDVFALRHSHAYIIDPELLDHDPPIGQMITRPAGTAHERISRMSQLASDHEDLHLLEKALYPDAFEGVGIRPPEWPKVA